MLKFTDNDMGIYMLMKKDKYDKCLMCDDETNYVEILSHGKFCSSECLNMFYEIVNRLCEIPN